MGIHKQEILTYTCDLCNEKIDEDELNRLEKNLNGIPVGYFMDQVRTIDLALMNYNIPYGGMVKKPIICRKCMARILAKVLRNVTEFKVDVVEKTEQYIETKEKDKTK